VGGAAGENRSERCLAQKAYGFPRSKAFFTEFLPPLLARILFGEGKKIKN